MSHSSEDLLKDDDWWLMMINSSSGTCNFFCKKSVKCTSAVGKQRANKRQKHAFEILEDNVGLVKQLPKRNYPEKKDNSR